MSNYLEKRCSPHRTHRTHAGHGLFVCILINHLHVKCVLKMSLYTPYTPYTHWARVVCMHSDHQHYARMLLFMERRQSTHPTHTAHTHSHTHTRVFELHLKKKTFPRDVRNDRGFKCLFSFASLPFGALFAFDLLPNSLPHL